MIDVEIAASPGNPGVREYRVPVAADQQTRWMLPSTFYGLADEWPPGRTVRLTGSVEPLYTPDLGNMLRRAKQRQHLVTLDTNASILYRDRAQELVDAGLARLRVLFGARHPHADALTPHYLPVDWFGPWLEQVAGFTAEWRTQRGNHPRVEVVYRLDGKTLPLLADTVALLGSAWVTRVKVVHAAELVPDYLARVLAAADEAATEHGVTLTEHRETVDRPYLDHRGLHVDPAWFGTPVTAGPTRE